MSVLITIFNISFHGRVILKKILSIITDYSTLMLLHRSASDFNLRNSHERTQLLTTLVLLCYNKMENYKKAMTLVLGLISFDTFSHDLDKRVEESKTRQAEELKARIDERVEELKARIKEHDYRNAKALCEIRTAMAEADEALSDAKRANNICESLQNNVVKQEYAIINLTEVVGKLEDIAERHDYQTGNLIIEIDSIEEKLSGVSEQAENT